MGFVLLFYKSWGKPMGRQVCLTMPYDYLPWLRITPRRDFRGIEMELIEHII